MIPYSVLTWLENLPLASAVVVDLVVVSVASASAVVAVVDDVAAAYLSSSLVDSLYDTVV
jgi:hypothetical protein